MGFIFKADRSGTCIEGHFVFNSFFFIGLLQNIYLYVFNADSLIDSGIALHKALPADIAGSLHIQHRIHFLKLAFRNMIYILHQQFLRCPKGRPPHKNRNHKYNSAQNSGSPRQDDKPACIFLTLSVSPISFLHPALLRNSYIRSTDRQ